MNKWWLIVLFCGGLFNDLVAQQGHIQKKIHVISGSVSDSSSGSPLPSATVTLLYQQKDSIIRGVTANEAGKFTLNNVPSGRYTLTIASLGYAAYKKYPVIVKNDDGNIALVPVSLLKKEQTLESVTVTAPAKLIDNRIDKLVYNAEKDLSAQTGVATDLLKKVPQVSVDVDGNVELAGSSSIRFLINGKPSTAFGSNVAEVLQSIPASQIKSIEVVTNPGARYDAEGLGGVINIILKKNTARGINTNISLTAGTLLENGSLNVAVREGNLGINGFISGNVKLPATGYRTSDRISTDTVAQTKESLTQDGSSRFRRHGIESGVGMDWTLKKKNNFSASLGHSVYGGNGTGSSFQQQVTQDFSGNPLSDISLMNYTGFGYRSVNNDISANYKRTFDKEDQVLEFEANTSSETNTGTSSNEQRSIGDDSILYGLQSRNPGTQKQTQLSVDYAQPLAKHVMLSAGAKTTFMSIGSNADVHRFDMPLNEYAHDSSLSNDLSYHQKVYALYGELTFPVGTLFDVKAGTRYERTSISTFYSNVNNHNKLPDYNTLVPSVYFSRKLEQGQVVKVSYTKRIERPGYDDLNPFINASDPKNITTGNPALKPQTSQRIELAYSRDISSFGTIMLAAFYRVNHQDIQPYTQYYSSLQIGDSIYQNVSVSTRENIGAEKNLGLNVFADVHFTTKFTGRTNVFVFHRDIINNLDSDANRSSMNFRMNVTATYLFTPLITGEFFGNFNSARNEVQGKYPSFTSYSLALRKVVGHKKGSVALTANNPFNNYTRQLTEVFGQGFTQSALRKIPFRSFGVNFTWKFGRLEFKKEAKEDQEEKDPVVPEKS